MTKNNITAMSLSRQLLAGLLLLAALLVSLVGFSPASAQTGPPPFDNSKDFGMVELVPGLFGTVGQKTDLKAHECVIGPARLVAPIIKKMGNSCDTKMFKKLSGVHKSGSLLWMLTLTPAGIHLSLSDKAVNLGNNLQDGMTFPYRVYDHPFAGKPLLLQQTNSAGGASVRAQIIGGVLAGVLNGTGAGIIAAATNPCNKAGGCGGTWNISGGVAQASADAVSLAQNQNHLNSNVSIAAPCSTGACVEPKR
jgi:hypothetical protein